MHPHIPGALALLLTFVPLATAQADYAVAYGTNGKRWAFGTSYDAATPEAAKQRALDTCGLKACRIVMSGARQCAAIAIGAQNNAAAWNGAETMAEAREGALVACSEAGRRCTVKSSFCDTASAPASDTGNPSSGVPKLVTTPGLPDNDARTYGTFVQALKGRLRSCINLSGATFSGNDTARLVVGFDDAGKLAFPPKISAVGSGPNAGAFATRLVIALDRCSPYGSLPGGDASAWKNITIDFAPEDFR